jgi:DNA-binding NarL/FixJ family response regulator
MSSVRILVVEDYEPFLRFICSTLEKRPELQVIYRASDGLEAVQKAEDLQPDLILLDIGLPRLNGIEAARRIRKVSPNSKILFLSQESSADVVQEALNVGALGYVIKTRGESELLTAVESVRKGMQFVSGVLSGKTCDDSADSQVPKSFRHHQTPSLAPTTQKEKVARGHAVRLYSDDALFIDGFTRSIAAALRADDAVIVVATESRRVSLLQGLRAGGVDVAAAAEQKHYVPLDVADTLTTFMAGRLSDPGRFAKDVEDVIVEAAKAAKRGHPRIAVY